MFQSLLSRLIAMAIGLLTVVGVGAVVGQPPETPPLLPVPFDASLSVGASYTCQFRNVDTEEVQTLTVQPLMVAFEPEEEVTLETPPERMMSDLIYPEPGVWEPIDDTWEMQLAIHDAQHRLSHAQVLNQATQSLVDQFQASPDGEWITGSVHIDVDQLDQQVDIYPHSPKLARIRLRGGDVKYADVQWGYGFLPNVPPPVGECAQCVDPPVRGDPYDVTGKAVNMGGGGVTGTFCAPFENNNPVANQLNPPTVMFKRRIVSREAGDLTILAKLDTPGRRQAINDALNREDLTPVLVAADLPPYSQDRAFWGVEEIGNIVAFVGVGYRKDKPMSLLSILGAVASLWQTIGQPPKFTVAAVFTAIVAQIRQDHAGQDEIITPLQETRFIAATWAVDANQSAKGFHQLMGYTQDVTFVLLGDTTPNGANQPISGSIHVSLGEAWTDPAPGGTGGGAEGDHPVDPVTGSVTIALTHGFRYQVTAQPAGNYQPPAAPLAVAIPRNPNNPINIVCTLQPMNPPGGGDGGGGTPPGGGG